MPVPRFCRLCVLVLILVSLGAQGAGAADAAQIQQSIAKGAGYLRSKLSEKRGGHKAFMALALYKAGLPAGAPEIQGAVNDILKQVDASGVYHPDGENYYSCSVAAVLLADINGEAYKPQLASMAAYLMGDQRPDGSWSYRQHTGGDTSVTHYALLGLWACARAGVPVPGEVWEKSIRWHMSNANPDGGFGYTPGYKEGDGQGASMPNMSINAVGSIAIAWINLAPDVLPTLTGNEPKPKAKAAEAKPAVPRVNDALEAVEIEDPVETVQSNARVPDGAINTMRRAYGWFAPKFSVENKTTSNQMYYYYSLERMAALVNVKEIGGHDWYGECADYLVANQLADGSWKCSSTYGPDIDTAFVVLSLVKSTAKLVKRTDPVATFGKGLLVGGRGLPDDLRNPNKPKATSKNATPLDQLLATLASADNFDVQDVQEQLVEQVQIGDREELIKQKDLLVKLIVHPDPEIRRTAAWALGRTNDMKLARYLVTALEDPDVDVNVEAHNGLCWISRKPTGPKDADISLDPLEGLPPDAGPDVKQAALSSWRVHALKTWGQWYLKNRPYRDRGDEFEAQLREKLATLN